MIRLVLWGFPENCENWSYEILKKAAKMIEEKQKIEVFTMSAGIGLLFAKPAEREKFLKGQ